MTASTLNVNQFRSGINALEAKFHIYEKTAGTFLYNADDSSATATQIANIKWDRT